MKKLILLLLFIPIVSFGQKENVKNEKDEYLELIKKLDKDNNGLIDEEIEEYLSNYDEPMLRSCKNVFKSQRRECFQNKMTKQIRKHFYYPKYAFNRGIQGKVFVTFIIEKDGSISEIKTNGADKSLEKAALKIIKKLPKLIPAKYKGKPVREPVSIPINWKLG